MGRVVSFMPDRFSQGERYPNLLTRDSVYSTAGCGDQKNNIMFSIGNPNLQFSSPVTDIRVILSLTDASLVLCTDYFVFPSRKDEREDRSDEKTSNKT
jgi:hypothetical protein